MGRKHGRAVALVSGLTCCVLVGMGAPAQARLHNGPAVHEVAEARSKAVERSKPPAAERATVRERTRERTRVARGRAGYGRYRAAAMARFRARNVMARTGQTPTWADDGSAEPARGDIVADWALTQIDKPYVWASAGPVGYDCSGLTMQAWARVGVKMDHWTGTQWTSGEHVPLDQLQRGDLLFFGRHVRGPADIQHVGIYIGRGLMVHAPQTGDVVRVAPKGRLCESKGAPARLRRRPVVALAPFD
ncbi:C40 family peptidase, partial [Streptosporangium sp. NPDC051023]|uniref:C40 family peptidase n=1 Tax=Streptosporangium sp. NPDC051023 TaxID=3155410 RepID=UPI00344BD0CB